MLVSWNWLRDYIQLDVEPSEVARRLMMAGLNHESSDSVGDDLAIDLEVTSNRPDCLGHIGIARECAVLCGTELKLPGAAPRVGKTPVSSLVKVRIDCPELCYRYTVRVIRGAKVGPSPKWLADRLRTIGIAVINNVVDITNYVLMECGQPLHAFDMAFVAGAEIIVREGRGGEMFRAIDHKTYALEPGMCVIADTRQALALGGVMGGADSEVVSTTRDVLIESAEFAPLSIRGTARKLKLHSPASYRFERGIDPAGVDWASRRCCELILDLAGGELAEEVVDVGRPVKPRNQIVLRLSQLPRVLGIAVPADEVRRILAALGNELVQADAQSITVLAPSWRRDLTREIDLIEEVARIYGYEQIPEDVAVPMCPSHRTDFERLLSSARQVLTAAGLDEAMTASVVLESRSDEFSPWSDAPALTSQTPTLKGADRLRRSLIPSLLEARRYNESVSNDDCELFETAKVYLPRAAQLPLEQRTLGIVSGGDFYHVKGIIEALLSALVPGAEADLVATKQTLLDAEKAGEFRLGGERLAVIGELTAGSLKRFNLRNRVTVAELSLEVLNDRARLSRQYSPQSPYPAITRDLNLILAEAVRWADLSTTVRQAGGELLESLSYREIYRDAKRDGEGLKRLLFSITLRSATGTLTNEEADRIRDEIVAACTTRHNARLVS